MKRMLILLLFILLSIWCAAASADAAPWMAETVKKEVNIREKPEKKSKKVTAIAKKGSQVHVLRSVDGTDDMTWYEIEYQGKKKTDRGWVRGDFLQVGQRPEPEDTSLTMPRDTVAATSIEEAYLRVLRKYQSGIAAYETYQKNENLFIAEYDSDFKGNTPLYIQLLDLTGDGQPELLFMCSQGDSNGEYDALYIYTWSGNSAVLILQVENVYCYGGNYPWYEIYRVNGTTDLYLRYGNNGPGTTERYRLNDAGLYTRIRQADCLFCGGGEYGKYDEYIISVDGIRCTMGEYEAAIREIAVPDEDLDRIASSCNPAQHEVLPVSSMDNGQFHDALSSFGGNGTASGTDTAPILQTADSSPASEQPAGGLFPEKPEAASLSTDTDSFRTVGNTVLFGRYEQDNNPLNGAEPIEWQVLDVQDGKALLVSRYILDAVPFNNKTDSVYWEDSTIRTWLNSVFLNTAFSESERSVISAAPVDNRREQQFFSMKDDERTKKLMAGAADGNDTEDRIFLLSYYEVHDKYSFFSYTEEEMQKLREEYAVNKDVMYYNSKTMSAPTDYAIAQGVRISDKYTTDGKPGGQWWLRSYFMDGVHIGVVLVDDEGHMAVSGPGAANIGIRPALRISLDAY